MSSSIASKRLRIAFALMLCAPLAHAGGDVMMFSGAVAVPTCNLDGSRVADAALRMATAAVPSRHFGCGAAVTTAYSAAAPQAYTVRVVPLASSALSGDRLGSYFAGYMHALGASDAEVLLATQAYD